MMNLKAGVEPVRDNALARIVLRNVRIETLCRQMYGTLDPATNQRRKRY